MTRALSCLIPAILTVLIGVGFSQTPNMRVQFTDDPFPGAMRPDTFEVLRVGQIPSAEDLDKLHPLGEFLSRLGKTSEELGNKLGIDGKLHPRAATRLEAAATRTHLRLVVHSREPHPRKMSRHLDTYFPDDRIDVFLDLDHDHHRFNRISVTPQGESSQQAYQVHENHLAWDRGHRKIEGSLVYHHEARIEDGGWTLQLDVELPRSSNNPAAPWQVIGLNVVRYRGVGGEETTMWCPDFNRVAAPLYFGDLYFGEPPVQVKAVTLGTVSWGRNKGRLVIDSISRELKLKVTSRNYPRPKPPTIVPLLATRPRKFKLSHRKIMPRT